MRPLLTLTLLWMTLFSLHAADAKDDEAGAADDSKLSGYEEVDYKLVQVSPEKYKNKRITYTGRFLGFTNTAPDYMVESGIDHNKYFLIGLDNLKVLAIAKKSRNKDLDELLAGLKPGATLQVYGRIKKFRVEPRHALQSAYYLEVVQVVVRDDVPAARGAGRVMERRAPGAQ
jgi:hypothetical protein